jgi:hypothetical protein
MNNCVLVKLVFVLTVMTGCGAHYHHICNADQDEKTCYERICEVATEVTFGHALNSDELVIASSECKRRCEESDSLCLCVNMARNVEQYWFCFYGDYYE